MCSKITVPLVSLPLLYVQRILNLLLLFFFYVLKDYCSLFIYAFFYLPTVTD